MVLPLDQETIPLREDADGVIRVTGTRVPLRTVVTAFVDGATPEQIALHYPAVGLAEAYAVIAYYLRHRAAVDAYLREQEARGETVRQEVAARGGRIDVQDLLRRRSITKELRVAGVGGA